MKNLKEIVNRTRTSISHISSSMNGKIKTLEHTVNDQNQRLADLENKKEPDIHVLEVNESNRKETEDLRQNDLSDKALRHDLKKEYGDTKWASGVIEDIVKNRVHTPSQNFSFFRRIYLKCKSFCYQNYNLLLKRINEIIKNN